MKLRKKSNKSKIQAHSAYNRNKTNFFVMIMGFFAFATYSYFDQKIQLEKFKALIRIPMVDTSNSGLTRSTELIENINKSEARKLKDKLDRDERSNLTIRSPAGLEVDVFSEEISAKDESSELEYEEIGDSTGLTSIVEIEDTASSEIAPEEQPTTMEFEDFNSLGNGLVYNCKEQQWACVSQDIYKKCITIQNWDNEKNESVECSPINWYNSHSNCQSALRNKLETYQEKLDPCM